MHRITVGVLLLLIGSAVGLAAPEASPAATGRVFAHPPDASPVRLLRQGDPLPGPHAVATEWRDRDDRAAFLLRVRDVVIPYRVLAITAVPGELLDLKLEPSGSSLRGGDFGLLTAEGGVEPDVDGRWTWRAPEEPGPYPIRIEDLRSGAAIHLNVLVLHPFEDVRDGALEGYRIGEYRVGPGRSTPPSGFFQAAEEHHDLQVSPSFTLGQFLCKQAGDPPFLALSEPLLLKLEALVEEVRSAGYPVATLQVMSGFRTPHYNRAIGNTTDGSRHLWGDAADVFVDTTGDGRMDDLTGDGRVTDADGRVLLALGERVEARAESHVRPGGLALYRANAARGPFVHVDARGTPARW